MPNFMEKPEPIVSGGEKSLDEDSHKETGITEDHGELGDEKKILPDLYNPDRPRLKKKK